jgi:hypothetical protein
VFRAVMPRWTLHRAVFYVQRSAGMIMFDGKDLEKKTSDERHDSPSRHLGQRLGLLLLRCSRTIILEVLD